MLPRYDTERIAAWGTNEQEGSSMRAKTKTFNLLFDGASYCPKCMTKIPANLLGCPKCIGLIERNGKWIEPSKRTAKSERAERSEPPSSTLFEISCPTLLS